MTAEVDAQGDSLLEVARALARAADAERHVELLNRIEKLEAERKAIEELARYWITHGVIILSPAGTYINSHAATEDACAKELLGLLDTPVL